jgi:hypothetical protein
MPSEGFIEYKRREFCNAVKCPVQVKLNSLPEESDEYERIRKECNTACLYTTWQFHHWLIERDYIIIASLKLKDKSSFFASIDTELLKLVDEQVQSGKFRNRSDFIESLLREHRKSK